MNNIFQTMMDVVQDVTGVPVILANQNAISLSGEYATILVVQSGEAESRGEVRQKLSEDGRDVTVTVKYPVTWNVTVNFFRGNAVANAAKLQRIHYLPKTSDKLLVAGIGFVTASSVLNLTDLQSKNFEQRAAITLTLTTFEEVEETVGVILEAGGDVCDESSNVVQKFVVQTH